MGGVMKVLALALVFAAVLCGQTADLGILGTVTDQGGTRQVYCPQEENYFFKP